MNPAPSQLGLTIASLVVAIIVALVATPPIRNIARRRGWMDHPDGRRKLHVHPIPRLGGVAVFCAFALTCACLLVAQRLGLVAPTVSAAAYIHLLIACTAVLVVGIADDIAGVSPWSKVIVQTLSAVYLFANGYRVTAISNPLSGESIDLGWASLPLTLLWFVAMSNAFNLIDGLDGLAAGVGFFSTTTLFIACVINERWEIAIIAAALGGALLGFLRYNFNPASVFLGDSGALFVGFALAAVAVRGAMKSSAAVAIAAPLMALAVPLIDAAVAVFRRLIRGEHPFQADGDHIHHRLLQKGLTPRGAVALLYAVAAAFGALSLLTVTGRGQIVGLVVIASSIVTWIGVQQLGYAEFAEIQRSLRYGLGNERRSMGNNVYLVSLSKRFAEAVDAEQLRSILVEASARLRFQRMQVNFEDRGERSLGEGFVVWRAADGQDQEAAPTSTWRVPICVEGRTIAWVTLARLLTEPTPFDPVYLLSAIQGGFGLRLQTLSVEERTATPPVSQKRKGVGATVERAAR